MQLEGKLAVITGAATGIERATAQLFAQEGAQVVVADTNEDDAQQTVDAKQTVDAINGENGSAWFARTDVSDTGDMDTLMKSVMD